MTEWTPSAREELDRYMDGLSVEIASCGADPAEVREDIARHIAEEAAAGSVRVLTGEEVSRILRKMGPPDPLLRPGDRHTPVQPGPPAAWSRWSWLSPTAIVLFGILLPAVTLGIELTTSMCADTFFDPIPTLWHVFLVAAVPVVNLVALVASGNSPARPWGWLQFLNGLVIAVALVYTFLFLPLVPMALVAVVLAGLGLLPLAPVLSLFAAIGCRRRLRRYSPETGRVERGYFLSGVVCAIVLLAAIEARSTFTHVGLQMAASDTPATRLRGIRWLRSYGDSDLMLRLCYQNARSAADLVGLLVSFNGTVTTTEAREIYYRVTGTPFNAVPPPEFRRLSFLEVEPWDADQAGAEVGEASRHLTLRSSRIDGSLDAQAALGYLEWTMVFHNASSGQREARAQIALPPGGVVSRLTLWVNGEEREAAFAARSQAREAYTKVVRRRQDPVLVTTSGRNRVLVQCFPVPAQGDMKIRIGITTPLQIDDPAAATLRLPRLIERNFGCPAALEHAVWLEAKAPFGTPAGGLAAEQAGEALHAVRGSLSTADLGGSAGVVTLRRDKALESWTRDPIDPAFTVRQQLGRQVVQVPRRVVLVVDASLRMQRVLPQIAEALTALPPGIQLGVVIASDQAETLVPPAGESHTPYVIAADRLKAVRCAGGADNAPALARAWELAAGAPQSVIVWVYGPQPASVGRAEDIAQRWERRPDGPRLIALSAVSGPNSILTELERVTLVEEVPSTGDTGKALRRLFAEWSGTAERWSATRLRVSTEAFSPEAGATETSSHLARLWAQDEVMRLLADRKTDPAARVALAASYQLVTPVSGAVVLETAQQYNEAGLRPVPPGSVPTIPEPETWALIIIVVLLFCAVLRQRRQTCRRFA